MKEATKTISIARVLTITSSNFADVVGNITDLNMIDVRFASLIKEFIILCRQTVQSSILFKYKRPQRIVIL